MPSPAAEPAAPQIRSTGHPFLGSPAAQRRISASDSTSLLYQWSEPLWNHGLDPISDKEFTSVITALIPELHETRHRNVTDSQEDTHAGTAPLGVRFPWRGWLWALPYPVDSPSWESSDPRRDAEGQRAWPSAELGSPVPVPYVEGGSVAEGLYCKDPGGRQVTRVLLLGQHARSSSEDTMGLLTLHTIDTLGPNDACVGG